MDEVVGTFVGRWYVTALAAAFLVTAVRHMGWRRTGMYAVLSVSLGVLAENGSVHLGFPYTRYSFNPALRGDELFVGDVPLFVPLSYSFMGYFAFVAGRLLASGPFRTRARRPWTELLMALVLAVWALWVLDPLVRLGRHFYLGEVFRYEGPGFWFGLPLGSQAGFTLTAVVLLALLYWLTGDEPARPAHGLLRHPHSLALLIYHAQVFHLVVVAWTVGGRAANTLAAAALLMWVPIAAMTAVHWSTLRLVDQSVSPAATRTQRDDETAEMARSALASRP
jgi:putative membrane protein